MTTCNRLRCINIGPSNQLSVNKHITTQTTAMLIDIRISIRAICLDHLKTTKIAFLVGFPKTVIRPVRGAGDIRDVHDDVIKWEHFLRYWPFVRGIHRSPVNSPHKGHWCGTLMFRLICAWINGWVNSHEAGDWRRSRAHYDVTLMLS